jgi:predicted N-acetyltransferase YhbS
MGSPRVEQRVGLDYLGAVTSLLQRIRLAHPTAGLYEAADFQWWWSRRARPTDDLPQLFWFDDDGRPVAAAIVTAWASRTQLDPIVLPGAPGELVTDVVRRGLDHARGAGYDAVSAEVDPDDTVLHDVLTGHGLCAGGDGVVEAWLSATDRPAVSALAQGYRLATRAETADRPHHMTNASRNHPDVAQRLQQTSLYRPELDLVVVDRDDAAAAYGLFWYDPTTATGLVEPMRTEDDHQRRGLARHVLTAGVERLAAAGAQRIKICYEPDNPASGHLYRSVGFRPDRHTVVLTGPTRAAPPGAGA